LKDHCRVIGILGMDGIGKTSVAGKFDSEHRVWVPSVLLAWSPKCTFSQ
jgi:hypothetical protein